MGDILYYKDLHDPVEGETTKTTKPKDMSAIDWTKLNRKVVGTIKKWLDLFVFHHVVEEIDA